MATSSGLEKPRASRAEHRDQHDDGQQDHAGDQQDPSSGIDDLPDAADHRGAEGRIDDQQDRAAVDPADQGLVLRSIQGPTQGRTSWPSTNGTSSWMTMPVIESQPPPAPWACISRPTSTGVRKMPSRFEAEAAQTAAATLPRPMEVKAIDDCTVEGRQHRNRMPLDSCGRQQARLADRQAQQGEQHEGEGQDRQVQPPVGQARDHGLARQLGAVQEEQQGDGDLDHPATIVAASPRTGRIEASTTMPNSRCQDDLQLGESLSIFIGTGRRPRTAGTLEQIHALTRNDSWRSATAASRLVVAALGDLAVEQAGGIVAGEVVVGELRVGRVAGPASIAW
jgi:hypothetical protein